MGVSRKGGSKPGSPLPADLNLPAERPLSGRVRFPPGKLGKCRLPFSSATVCQMQSSQKISGEPTGSSSWTEEDAKRFYGAYHRSGTNWSKVLLGLPWQANKVSQTKANLGTGSLLQVLTLSCSLSRFPKLLARASHLGTARGFFSNTMSISPWRMSTKMRQHSLPWQPHKLLRYTS